MLCILALKINKNIIGTRGCRSLRIEPHLILRSFYGKTDFDLWIIKMKALMVHQGLTDALKGDSGESSTTDDEE
ncbi:hypothetical protein ACS0TY_015386 [Phlomoides rotata]